MARAGFCAECGTNVWLNADDSCVNGHPASGVSNIYETAASAPVSTPVPTKSHAGLIVGIVVGVFAALFLCGIMAAIAVPVFLNASGTAKQKSCFANQRLVEGALQLFVAQSDRGQMPTDWPTAIAAIVPGIVKSEPRCPAGGTYSLEVVDGEPVVTCSIHGNHASASPPQ